VTKNTVEMLESENAALPSPLFHGWGGDRQQGVCEQGVREGAGTIRNQAEGWREEAKRRSIGSERFLVEFEGFEDGGVKRPESRDQNPEIRDQRSETKEED